jgi:quercetin dioxygenase-like cupin family protein
LVQARFWIAVAAALALGGCLNISRRPDPLLGSIAQTTQRECPADRRVYPPRAGGETERVGVVEYEFARVALSNARGTLRTRRLDIAPGGLIPWHEHTTRQGIAMILAGEMMEYRSDCLDPIRYRVGDIAREDQTVAHYWRNEGMGGAVVLVTDVLP